MARYLEVAAEANTLALKLLELVPETDKPKAAEMIARLVNYGIRCSPRGVQHTVRLNAVRRAVRDLPVVVNMVEIKDERTGRTYNALATKPVGGVVDPLATVEGATEGEGD